MSNYKLYEVAAIERPEIKKDEQPKVPIIILEPKVLLARSDQDAVIKAALKYKDELGKADPERIDLIVRPF